MSLLETSKEVRFKFLKDHHKEFDIWKTCKALKISKSGYYAYLERKPSKRFFENKVLCDEIKLIFEKHLGRYGSVRIQKKFKKKGILVNHKQVAKLMRSINLYAKGLRKSYINYVKETKNEEKSNLLNQVFKIDQLNKAWLGDITYIPTKKGFLYLSVFIDLFSQKVVGWSMNKTMKEEIVINAFLQAWGKENPYDNAIMESFYRTLKRELINDAHYENREQAQQDIFKYIEIYYNTENSFCFKLLNTY